MKKPGYKHLVRAALGLAYVLLLPAASAQATRINVPIMAQESIPPKWILENGVARGVCADLIAAIERTEPRIHFTGYDRGRSLMVIEDALASGRVWAACGMLESVRRHRIALRSEVPVFETRHRLAAAAGDTQPVESFDDLVRLKALINTARGSAYIDEMKARGIAVDDSTGDNVVNLRKILAGHGRYTYMNELSLAHLIRSEHLENKVRVLPAVLTTAPLYFWVSKKADPALAPMLDQALVRLKANGDLARIYERWARIK